MSIVASDVDQSDTGNGSLNFDGDNDYVEFNNSISAQTFTY